LCSDGSSVGRNPDNGCAFFPCPTACNNDNQCATGLKCRQRCRRNNQIKKFCVAPGLATPNPLPACN
jgi:hypothetical protein